MRSRKKLLKTPTQPHQPHLTQSPTHKSAAPKLGSAGLGDEAQGLLQAAARTVSVTAVGLEVDAVYIAG
jgi:hypothetical protein